MKISHGKNRFFLIFLSVFLSNYLIFSVFAAKKSKSEPAVKEYVVVSTEKNSILERLNLLFDKLKLFANYPKNLKELQEKTNSLEDSLRKKLAEIKDSSYIISGVHDEVSNARNDIPIQETNEKAKKLFDKIVEFWNSANGEMEKITKSGQEFETIVSEIKAKMDEIGKVLEEGNTEINNIKNELEKIAKIEEEIAGKNEREISEQISLLIDKKNSKNKVSSESSDAMPTSKNQVTEPKVDYSQNDTIKTLSFWQSLEVVWKIFVNFAGVAWNGVKDLFVRLFVVQTETKQPENTLIPNSDQKSADVKETTSAQPSTKNSEDQPKLPVPQSQEEAQYKEGMVSSLYQLKNAVISLANNGFLYLKKIYSNMRAEKQPEDAEIQPKNAEQSPISSEPSKKLEEKKTDEPKPDLKTAPDPTMEPKIDEKKEKPKSIKLKLGK